MNPICFYHRADLDGVCSGAIVKHFVPDCEMVGFDYGDEFPWDKVRPGPDAEKDPLWEHLFKPENGYESGTAKLLDMPPGMQDAPFESIKFKRRTVYMVDVSLNNPADMKRLAEVSNFVWIDHHKSAIDSVDRDWRIKGWREVGRAACELCWEWFTSVVFVKPLPYDPPPEAVRLLGRYDVWDKDHPDWATKILPFQYGMRAKSKSHDPTAEGWEIFVFSGEGTGNPLFIDSTIETGNAILSFQAEQNKAACADCAFEAYLWLPDGSGKIDLSRTTQGYCLICLNTPNRGSQNIHPAYDATKHDIMCVYATLKDGRYRVSFYSEKPEIDCGAICKSLGGGGHKGAAGFLCTELPWSRV